MSRICFVSYELHPVTPGGCGVLLYNAAHVLLERGHEVIFVLDMSRHAYERFRDEERDLLPHPERCRSYDLNELCQDIPFTEGDFVNHHFWRAYRFHWACRQVAQMDQPDVIEFFDYCGVGHYALNAKMSGLDYCNCHLAVRLHNSIEIIDANQASSGYDLTRHYIYALEHSALRLAETVLYPSLAYLDLAYRPYYGQWYGRTVLSQPPLLRHPQFSARLPQADVILFYGRIFGFKGVDRFVDAAVAFLSRPENPRRRFCLVGYDSGEAPDGSGRYQDFLWRKIPPAHRAQFEFTGQLTWEQIEQLLPRVLFAVVPSYFESFCYAAHELYAAGVPVIVSDIPAFRDYFVHERNCLKFDGSVSDLTRQMERLSSDAGLRARLSQPYPLLTQPLGDFYEGPFPATWTQDPQSLEQPPVLVCVIGTDDGCMDTTLAALKRIDGLPMRIVVLRPAGDGAAATGAWLLGQMYCFYTADGHPLEPTQVRAGSVLLILRAGDIPQAEFLQRGVQTLARYPHVGYVTCWKEVIANDGSTSIDTFPLEAASELVPFLRRPLLNRCLMRTPANQLLIDVFDVRAGCCGEIQYLWDLEENEKTGVVISQVLIAQKEESPQNVAPRLLAYLVLHGRSRWRSERLARYASILSHGNDPLVQELAHCQAQLNALRNSLTWRVGHAIARRLPGQLLRRVINRIR
jgi:glycosyltransferase involved in cell wall biosynthesis